MMDSKGVQRPEVLNDDVIAKAGDHWSSNVTAVFSGTGSQVTFDLGSVRPIRSARLQGDNNDEYTVSVSDDGTRFEKLWVAGTVRGPGVQMRQSPEFNGHGRYVRVEATKGDGSYGVGEVQVFSVGPADAREAASVRQGIEVGDAFRSQVLLFGLALLAATLVARKRGPLFLNIACIILPLWALLPLVQSFMTAWPPSPVDVAFVRGAVAGTAALIVAREIWIADRFRASRAWILGALSLCAVVGMSAFYNLGRAQFWDHQLNKPGLVHNYDMHVYYPVAKYFKELRFDGLYLASMAAYVENVPGTTIAPLNDVELRDLRTHETKRVSEVADQIAKIKNRFSPERWELFRKDVRYFHENMGSHDFLGNMTDHGGNATPVWLAIAHVLFAKTVANNTTLLLGALLDPLLLALLFVVIGRTFGVRTMLMSALLFGANDFYMFGTDWAGATLRHDWLVYLGLGICALKAKRWMLAGAMLAFSTAIRAFPVIALAFTAVPVLFWLGDYAREHRRLPRWSERSAILRESPVGPFLRIMVGALVSACVLFVFSGLVFSFDAWVDWLHKVSMLDRDPHVNDVSLRALVAGASGMQHSVFRTRWLVFAVLFALWVMGAAFGARGRFHMAALGGCFLIPLVFNPANYYVHYVCLLPMLVTELRGREETDERLPLSRDDARVWLVLLGMCVAQYWTVLVTDLELHFLQSTAVYFAAGSLILLNLATRRPTPEEEEAAGPHGAELRRS